MSKTYELPPIVWLRVTDFMHGWLQHDLGCAARIGDQHVVTLHHIPAAREALRMETVEDVELKPMKVGNAMSATRKNMLEAGMAIAPEYIAQTYDLTPEAMKLFVPIECPSRCLTSHGVLRPWTHDVTLGRQQSSELIRIIRAAFWQAVETFNADYARRLGNTKYPSIDMCEAFCRATNTPDIHAEAIKREWNRRVKNGQSKK